MSTPLRTVSHIMNSSDMDYKLHCIESEAYIAVLRALTAQGGPTWDHLDTLFGLRKELRISDAEHKEFIAKVESDDSVNMIRQWREGTIGEKELFHNDISPPPAVSSLGQASSKRLKTLHGPLSSFSKHPSDSQPLPAANPSSLATQYSSQCGVEAAKLSSRESIARPVKSVSHSRTATLLSKGMIIQSKKSHQLFNIQNFKKRLGTIEIRATNDLIREVEKLICSGNYPNLVQVEKAKVLLKEQERSIIEAIDKLAEFSDEDCLEQQRIGHQLATPYVLYGQPDKMKGYYNTNLNVNRSEGGSTFCQPGRYLETP